MPPPDASEADKRLELAYDAAEKKLSMQDATLSNVRSRASNLLATAALFTSFATAIGLVKADPEKGSAISPGAAALLLAVVVALGGCVIVVIWPIKGWVFVPSAEKIMARYDAGDDEEAIRRYVIHEMIAGGKRNAPRLRSKQTAFRIAASLLVVEVALLVLVLFMKGVWSWLLCFLD